MCLNAAPAVMPAVRCGHSKRRPGALRRLRSAETAFGLAGEFRPQIELAAQPRREGEQRRLLAALQFEFQLADRRRATTPDGVPPIEASLHLRRPLAGVDRRALHFDSKERRQGRSVKGRAGGRGLHELPIRPALARPGLPLAARRADIHRFDRLCTHFAIGAHPQGETGFAQGLSGGVEVDGAEHALLVLPAAGKLGDQRRRAIGADLELQLGLNLVRHADRRLSIFGPTSLLGRSPPTV